MDRQRQRQRQQQQQQRSETRKIPDARKSESNESFFPNQHISKPKNPSESIGRVDLAGRLATAHHGQHNIIQTSLSIHPPRMEASKRRHGRPAIAR
jgi:hypothetical protein